jgi:transcriptional regulator with XRE-family HTH domain
MSALAALDPAVRARRIRKARQAEGLTMRQLAAFAGTSAGYLGQLELGQHWEPDRGRMRRLAEALDLPSSAFLDA